MEFILCGRSREPIDTYVYQKTQDKIVQSMTRSTGMTLRHNRFCVDLYAEQPLFGSWQLEEMFRQGKGMHAEICHIHRTQFRPGSAAFAASPVAAVEAVTPLS